jgi:hypothetical protein
VDCINSFAHPWFGRVLGPSGRKPVGPLGPAVVQLDASLADVADPWTVCLSQMHAKPSRTLVRFGSTHRGSHSYRPFKIGAFAVIFPVEPWRSTVPLAVSKLVVCMHSAVDPKAETTR